MMRILETKIYTLAELQAMDDDTLNTLAAELRGWYLEEVEEFSDRDWYFGNNSHPTLYRTYKDDNGFVCHFKDWKPATDRNQSAALLQWAAETHNIIFTPCFHPEGASRGFIWYRLHRQPTQSVQGNTARTDTIAFCAAMLAISQRLN